MFLKQNRIIFLFILSMSFSLLFPEGVTRGLLKNANISPKDIYSNQWALIIGVNQYTEYPPLRFAVEDAKSIQTTLTTQYGFPEENIEFITDSDATKARIEDAFYNLAEKTNKNDAVVIFFAGHGETRRITGSDEDLGYLIPVDGKADSLTRTTLSMKTIKIFSNEIPAKSVLFLVDACYGGLAAAGQYRSNRNLDIVKGLTKDRSRMIITAGKKDELVVENEKWGHSAFTSVLIEGLQDSKADTDNDGIILTYQLFAFIQSNVLKLTEGGQTPQFNQLSTDEGEFAFIDQNIISDLFDVDLSGFGFLTIPSDEPFGALIKINDILIDKKTPLISEKLNSGYHTITISKKGYKDYSKRVFITPNLTETIIPIMNLIEGVVSFSNLPNFSNVNINGKSIGSTPLDNIILEKGNHTIEVNIPGYEKLPPIDLNIENSILYPLTLPRLVPKTKTKAFMRSAVIPGWGQRYYEEPVKSNSFGAAALLSGLFCIYNQVQYSQLIADYDKAVADYQNSGDPETKVASMLDIYNQLEVNEKNTNMGTYVFGGIYTLNLIDIILGKLFTSSGGFSDGKVESDVKVGITPSGPGFEIGIRF